MTKKPFSVDLLSLVGVGLSLVGILIMSLRLLTLFSTQDLFSTLDPVPATLQTNGFYWAVSLVLEIVGIALGFLLFVASYGTIKLDPWARRAMIVSAWMVMFHGVVSTIFALGYVIPKFQAAEPSNMNFWSHIRMYVVYGRLFSIAFSVSVLWVFSRAHVIAVFDEIARRAYVDDQPQ